MNKDIVGLIYCILYRLKFDEIVNDYRDQYDQDEIVGCIYDMCSINYRNISKTHDQTWNIYKLKCDEVVGTLPKKYYNVKM